MAIEVIVRSNKFQQIEAELARKLNAAVREQVLETQSDVQQNIVKYDLIDTGNMLGSVQGTMTGQLVGEVTVSAESEAGFPYPSALNGGTRYIPAMPFFSEAVTKAEDAFPRRLNHLI